VVAYTLAVKVPTPGRYPNVAPRWPQSGAKKNQNRYIFATGRQIQWTWSFMQFVRVFLGGFALLTGLFVPALSAPRLADINKKTVTLLAGEPAWFADGLKVANSLAHENGLRVLPMQGSGCISSAADVLQLTQVDVGLLTSDCVAYAELQGLLPGASKKLAYVSRVRSLPLLLVTRKTVPNLTALAGKRIATGPAASASFVSGELLLGGIDLPFVRVPKSGVDAIDALKRGDADAVLMQGLAALDTPLDPSEFHVLGLPAPAEPKDAYAPALIDAADLKGLAGVDTAIETVSTSLVLAVFNWPASTPKAAKLKLFAEAYFDRVSETRAAPELSTSVVGWKRYAASQKALDALTITAADEPPDTLQEGDGP
jgi:TRAP-type uncharacterized transport system substrate-binding protein